MILDPRQLRFLSREMDSPACEIFESKLQDLHYRNKIDSSNMVLIPRFWSETVFYGIQKMLKELPNLKIGSIVELKNRLRIYTIPTTGRIEVMKIKLYNEIDTLALETIDRLLEGDKKSFLMT